MKLERMEQVLQYNDEHESKVYMPNEIFEDLLAKFDELKPSYDEEESFEIVTISNGMERKKRGKNKGINISHVAFAYSYYYFICWLYRYTRYINTTEIFTNGRIKEILGYHADVKGLDYITKKNGLLDQMEYTQTTNDIPMSWSLDKYEGLTFYTTNEYVNEERKHYPNMKKSEIISVFRIPHKYTIKYPVKAFERTVDEEGHTDQEGTFFGVDNTHLITFDIFLYCMDNEKIGTIGFYLYCFIKRMNDMYSDGWDVPFENMVKETGVPESTLLKYLDQLRKYTMITVDHNQEYYCTALTANERKANTYHANKYEMFSYKEQSYKKMKVITADEYYKKRKEEFEKLSVNAVDIPLEQLPY